MPEINLPTKAGQDSIINTVNNVNTNVDNVKTNLASTVGTNADGSNASGSLHAKMKDMKTSLGNPSDGASREGNVHQKLRDIRNNGFSGYSQKAIEKWSTLYRNQSVSFSGSGVLTALTARGDNGNSRRLTFIVDGVEIGYTDFSPNENRVFSFVPIYFKSSLSIRSDSYDTIYVYPSYALS